MTDNPAQRSGPATRETLYDLHRALTEALMQRLTEGEEGQKASLLAVARAFLADNGIFVRKGEDTGAALAALLNQMDDDEAGASAPYADGGGNVVPWPNPTDHRLPQ